MGKGIQGLNDLLNQNFGFAKKLYSRAFAELEIIVEDDEESIFLTNADYDDENGIQTGLILISNSRIIYANRRKGDSALILKIMFEEVNTVYFDTGLISGSLSLKGTLYEFVFQNMANADGKKISKHISRKVTVNQNSKSQFSLESKLNVDKTKSLLQEVFDTNNGWVFGTSQIRVEMINEEKFKLSIMGFAIMVSEKVRVLKKQDKALKISEIVLHHEFKDIELKYHNSLLKKIFTNGMIMSYSLSNMNQIVVSTSFPVFQESSAQLLRKQLIFRLLVLLEDIKEFRKSGIVLINRNKTTSKSHQSKSVEWSDVFDFLNSAADVIQTVGDIVDIVSGEAGSEED